MSRYFPEPNEQAGGNVKVELDSSNYAAKSHLKEATDIDTSMLTSKADLTGLKPKVDNLNADNSRLLLLI